MSNGYIFSALGEAVSRTGNAVYGVSQARYKLYENQVNEVEWSIALVRIIAFKGYLDTVVREILVYNRIVTVFYHLRLGKSFCKTAERMII